MNKFKFLVFILLFCQVLFSKDTVSVQLLWKHQFEFSGFYVAKELGFYNDIGLDVEIKEITPNINVASEVENKNATFGIGRTSLLIDIENGKDFILLSPIFQYSPSILLTLKSSGIKDPNDLFGKKVMIASGSEYDAEFFTAFRNMGIDFLKDTTIQQHSTSINDLINGNTDAMYAYISNEPFLLKEQGIEYNILNPKNYGFDFYGDIVFTTKEFAMENPILVKKFREATHKGFEWAFANIDKTIDLIYNKYNSQNKSKDALRYEAYELKKIAYYETDRIGTITKSKLQRMVDLYKNNGLLKTNLNTDEIVFEYDKYNLSLTPEELGYLKNKKILKVHNELEYKPFNFFKSNMPTGYSIDLMNLVAKKLNVQVEYQTGPSWSDFIEMLKVGDIDVMLNITPTQGRKEFFNFTNPYKKYNYLIYSNVTKKISSINDLDGKKVALIKDFAVYEIIKSLYPKIEIVEVKSMKDAIIAVGLSQADATITIQPIAQNIIFENGIYNVIPTGEIFLNDTDSSQVNLSMATNKKDNILNGILNKALYSITYDEMIQLEQKWFASTQSSEQNIIFTTQESEYLKDKKVVHLCVDPNWMPFESIEKGKLIGVSKDFMDIFETKLGIPIKLIPTKTWQESIKLAKARECDIFSLATQTEPRKEYMNFTTPYVSTPLVIATITPPRKYVNFSRIFAIIFFRKN